MRLDDVERSKHIEDRRGQTVRRSGMRKGGGILSLLIVLVGAYYGVDLSGIVNLNGEGGQYQAQSQSRLSQEEEQALSRLSGSSAD